MKILIISHFYAPYSQVGAKRMTALAVFFAKKGEQVYVVRANEEEYGTQVVENVAIHENVHVFSLEKNYKNDVMKKIMRNHQYWKVVKPLLVEKKIDTVIVSGGPFNYFALTSKIKKYCPSVKCILDFRDILDGSQCQSGRVSFLQNMGFKLDIRTEQEAVQKADLCLTVSEQMNEFYQKRYEEYREKFIVVQNGYDNVTLSVELQKKIEENMENSEHTTSNLYYLGVFGKYGFYDENYYDVLVNGVKRMHQKGIKIIIVQFGVQEERLQNKFRDNGLEEHYLYETSVGYEKDLLKLQTCDATIATSYLKEALGTKIFDYIWLNKPIITINPHQDGEQIKLTNKFENGFSCTKEEEFIEALENVVALNTFILDSDEEKRKKFGREFQFEKLYAKIQ